VGSLLCLTMPRARAAFAADDMSRRGETAKATDALGSLPYHSLMTRFTTSLRLFLRITFESRNKVLCCNFGTRNAFKCLGFSLHDDKNAPVNDEN